MMLGTIHPLLKPFRILHHLVRSPRALSPKQWSLLGDKITKTIAIAKLRTSEVVQSTKSPVL